MMPVRAEGMYAWVYNAALALHNAAPPISLRTHAHTSGRYVWFNAALFLDDDARPLPLPVPPATIVDIDIPGA